ncbi:MAG: phage tail tape measure protein [Pelagimonas sp.]|jgi:TP901 family phage tail tape measure protein|nr:phage tail tape measure protein [Pelagimonas sp.]
MTDLTISMILKLVDQATAPARRVKAALGEIGETSERIGRQGVAWSNRQLEANRGRQQALAGEAFAVAALAGSIGAALQPAINFEQAMAEVGAVAGASQDDLAALTDTARELGANTSWSASQAAEGMKFLSMAGFEANETIAAMPGLLDLASAGATDLGQASDIASDILSAFKMEAGEIGHLGDVLANTFTSSNTNLSMLGETMKYVAPVAQGLGISLEDTAAMAGKLADAGIKGSQAGTSMRAMMSRLAAPTKEAREALNALGVQTLDADGNLRDFHTVLAEIDRGLDQFGTGKQQDLISAIAGLEAASAAAVLLDMAGSGALQSYADSLEEAGSAARIAAQMNDTTAGALRRLGSITESLAISVGSILLPELVALLEAIMPVIGAVEQWAAANPELVSWIARGVAGLIAFKGAWIAIRFVMFAALGPLLQIIRAGSWLLMILPKIAGAGAAAFGVIGRILAWVAKGPVKYLLSGIGLIIKSVLRLGAVLLANPIGLVIASVAALAYAVYDNWDRVVSYVSDKVDTVRAAFDEGLVQGVFAVLSEFNPFVLALDGIQGLIAYAMELLGVPDEIVASFREFDLFETGRALLQSLWDGMSALVPEMVAGISEKLSGIMPERMKDAWNWVAGGEDQTAAFAALPEDQRRAAELVSQAQASGPLPTQQYLADLEEAARRERALIAELRADLEANPIGDNLFGSAFDGRDNLLARAEAQLAAITAEQETARARAGDLQSALQLLGETEVAPEINAASLDAALVKAGKLAALLNQAGGGAVSGSVPGIEGERDAGGPVRPHLPYLLGERGPELFVPDVAGQILPTRALQALRLPQIDMRPALAAGQGGPQITHQGDTITIHIAPPPGMDPREIARAVRRELDARDRRRGGDLHDGVALA